VGFTCGVRALDDFFARHALANEEGGLGRVYVLRRVDESPGDDSTLPAVLGFYTLSMASAEAAHVAEALQRKLPRYPMPVALIGRLAVDRRAQRLRLGEKLLVDAIDRVVAAASVIGCLGIVVDAKDEGAAHFYAKYGFVFLAEGDWPRRMFLPIATAREALSS
jgi:ribosomal protein S18 acetylase RimI-like enzyme